MYARDHLGLGKLTTKDNLIAKEVGAIPMNTKSLSQALVLDELSSTDDYCICVSRLTMVGNQF